MKPLRKAIEDYVTLRRSLGFKLKDMAPDLLDFAAFLEQKAAPYITTELAMEWAMLPKDHQPSDWAQRLGFIRVFARHWHATSTYRDSPTRLAAVPAPARTTLSVFGTRDRKALGSGPQAFSPERPAATDIPLPVRITRRGRLADQRGSQTGTDRCGSPRGHPHYSADEVRQDAPGSAPHFHSGYPGRLRPASRPVAASGIVALFLSQRSRPPARGFGRAPHLL